MRPVAISVVLLALLPAGAAAAPTLSRSSFDPGQLVLQIPSVAGESRYYSVDAGSQLVFRPNPDDPPPVEPWTISAPDCQQNQQTGDVTCSAPVTSLVLGTEDGDEGFNVTRVSFPLLATLGGGTDFIGGGVGDDVIDAGAGIDLVDGDKGDDRVIGGPDDDDLFGGPGRDRIDGGLGSDRMFGEAGLDRLLARDDTVDRRINCGAGNDRKERAKVDPGDPRAGSC